MSTGHSRYVVGIDLGTTHSVLSYLDTRKEKPEIVVLELPQLVDKGALGTSSLLPSFMYFAHEGEADLALPWAKNRKFAVGEFARARSIDAPLRVVSSAKSWLSHPSVDRRQGILPPHAPEDVEKVSPVEASFRFLEHLVDAFDTHMKTADPGQKLADQDVVITVPASFDPSARELTVEAATAAGLEHVTLLEEPQASLYAWTQALGDQWRKSLRVGDVLLVVDIGGGTSDFSVIMVRDRDGAVELERVAVGDHILLGGDNMDLLLAHVAKEKLEAEKKPVDAAQAAALVSAARAAKELLLARGDLDVAPIAVASRGSKLVGGTLRTELSRKEVEKIIVQGFFPEVPSSAVPEARTRAGFAQLGLPYAQDAAVTKHLAAFLAKHAKSSPGSQGPMLKPTCVLFNGGVMKSDVLRKKLVGCMQDWLKEAKAEPLRVLEGADYDLSVARGAAYYGLVRRGRGLRIRGGTSKSFYVGIEGSMPAVPGLEPPLTLLCVAPYGMEEGTEVEVGQGEFGVVVGEPVSFRFFGATARRQDTSGTSLPTWPKAEFEELSPIRITLESETRPDGDVVPVKLVSRVTEIGTMEIHAVPKKPLSPDERWKIELSLRT